MPSVISKLYAAASSGSVQRTLDLLSSGSSDIDRRCDEDGWTPLVVAVHRGYLRIVRVLLRFGADMSVSADDGHTALHCSIGGKHRAVSKALIKAGADIEAPADFVRTGFKPVQGQTPLHLATEVGFSEGMVALVDAGAKVNSRMSNGATPLYIASCMGNLTAVKILLHKKANPLLRVGTTHPIEIAAQQGHLEVVRELVQRLGVNGCSDEGGVGALETAAYKNQLNIVTFLLGSGIVDFDGTALCAAIEGRNEACIKLMVSRMGGNANIVERAYTNIDTACGNPLLCAFDTGRGYAPRIVKFLLEHGADTKMKVRFEIQGLGKIVKEPLVAAKLILQHEQTHFEVADGEAVDGLKGVVRLLQQEAAVHANSWAWPTDTRRSTNINRKLPAFRIRRGPRPSVPLAMERYINKHDGAFQGYENKG